MLEVGLLSSIYLTGTTSTGGFVLRPHLYWVDVQGEKQDSLGNITPSSKATQGLRSGAEIVYQKILTNGFNFEVGGGFSYYLIPYDIGYPQPGIADSQPSSRIIPTISIGIGWAL
jgi:hypothetical protein